MRCERFTLADGGEAPALARRIRALVPAPESVRAAVAAIIEDVRADGDDAIAAYTRQFDTGGVGPAPLRVTSRELDAAAAALDPAIRAGLERAIANLTAVARASLDDPREVVLEHATIVTRSVPVARAAVYVPGGRAPYPSTVVMGVVPALVAGVREVVVCAPPKTDGDVDAVILGACRLAGATEVYRMGGVQAIAALAYGTDTIEPVDVIVGPGNLYVQEAKRQVFGQVGIDGFAGPSDLLLIADGGVYTGPLTLDLLAQAEHGPGTLVVATSNSDVVLGELAAGLSSAPETGAIAAIVGTGDGAGGPERALALAQAFAPEHLQLAGPEAEALAPAITRAGCVFVGASSGTAFGDYIAGSNHVLPTNGAARYASA
ncbi:MAG TPA: histidinol dehydrogenase, partial [Solirubrobacteraceae bacterium]|nr:histidinol dehydrogenase [Solirubrobacteraceae bacterium]